MLVNARQVKVLAGRKTEVADAAWLAGAAGARAAAGQLRGRRRPSASCATSPATASGRFQATPPRSNESRRPWRTPGSSWTRSPPTCWGPRAGRCWPPWLAGSAIPGCWPSWPVGGCAASCPSCARRCGAVRDHHALLLRLALGHLEHLEGAIAALDRRVDEVIAPFARARDRLDTITGVGKRAAETIIAEVGVDMSVFPTAGHLASWAGRCPGNNLTGASAAPARPPRATAGWARCSSSAPGPRPAAATPTCQPSIGGWPAASASRKAAIAVGHPGPGGRLAPVHR
jgi:transposase